MSGKSQKRDTEKKAPPLESGDNETAKNKTNQSLPPEPSIPNIATIITVISFFVGGLSGWAIKATLESRASVIATEKFDGWVKEKRGNTMT